MVLAYDQYVMERMALPHGPGSDFVLVNLFAEPLGAPMTTDSITELFGRLSKRAGLSRNVTPRMLRRAAGSNLADAGGGQDEIAALLDHSAQIVRQMRQNFLGMPRIRQPLPDLRPERPA
ncbi:tyrosine-type recombinase/integrase [Streptomyces sp. NPDC056441]|uniref:tyrosine-type recombinase/integrase n=1 Tax=Streptomyces sp. NPDC056441 TaxID=3345817 RepID=UPI00369D6BAC